MTYAIRSVPDGQLLGSGIRQNSAGPGGARLGGARPGGARLGGARPGAARPGGARPGGQALSAAEIVHRLEQAGATLLAMPATGYSTRMRQMRFDIVHTALEAYGWETPALRAPAPDSAAISAMDEAFGWLALIPESQFLLRRILGARALVHPLTGRYLFTWRRLAAAVGADHKSVQRWHGQAVEMVARALAGPG